MHVSDIMSHKLNGIAQDASISNAAQLMRELDIGMLPVVQDGDVIGTLTDRDITIRATAAGADPNQTHVSDVMSHEIYTCLEDDDLKKAAKIMEEHQIRRLMVQDKRGKFVGLLALADLARHHETEKLSVEILEEVSKPTAH